MNILLICSTGISTSILVERIKQAAKKENTCLTIRAVSEVDLNHYLEQTDVILIGPHLSHLKADITTKANSFGIQVDIIQAKTYGLMDGEGVLQQAKELFNERELRE